MVIRLKDTAKLFGITIIACCAVFVCTLFLSYNIDLAAIKDEIVTEAGTEMYNAQVLMGRVIAAVSGGCLIATSVVMLLFYVKNYISTHGKELGILKALGYSNIKIAMQKEKFILCPVCGNKTRVQIREDTELKNFPLFCPKCHKQTLINAKQLNITTAEVPDAKTQSR